MKGQGLSARQRWIGWLGTALAGACLTAAAARAADPPLPPPNTDPRDISGVWFGEGNTDPTNGRFVPVEGGEPPLNAAGAAIAKERRERAEAGKPINQPADVCMPHGLPAAIRLPTPLQVIQTPGQVTIIQEASRTVRIVFLDESHPAGWQPTFMGHSVGRWEGDTLVVDTIGERENWLDVSGNPASEQRHIVERIKKIDGGKKLEDVLTITDPKYYTRPWTVRRDYFWSPEERVQEYVCEESDRYEPGQPREANK